MYTLPTTTHRMLWLCLPTVEQAHVHCKLEYLIQLESEKNQRMERKKMKSRKNINQLHKNSLN